MNPLKSVVNVQMSHPMPVAAFGQNKFFEIKFSIIEPFSEDVLKYIKKQLKYSKDVWIRTVPRIEGIIECFFENDEKDLIGIFSFDRLFEVFIYSDKPINDKYNTAIANIVKHYEGKDDNKICFDMACFLSEKDTAYLGIRIPRNYEKAIPLSNYATKTHRNLDDLEDTLESDNYLGSLILLEGPPGTGKSYYIKRLVSLLLQQKDENKYKFKDVIYFLGEGVKQLRFHHVVGRNILIFEEGDFIMDGENLRSKPFLKILNLSSGFVETDSLMIFTTNANIGNIDEAFTRDGRMIARIHFDSLEYTEAMNWIKEKDSTMTIPTKTKYSLAKLYALYTNAQKIDTRKKSSLGFSKK